MPNSDFEKTCHLELEPQVDILQNGRRRVVRRFELGKNNNIDDVIFRGYGDADPGKITSCTTGYANLRLIAQKVEPQQNKRASVLVQVFETLTDAWVKETDDVVDHELNGLKRSTQVFVARPGTDYETFVVGTSTTGTSPVQYLASKNAVETDGLTRLTLVYLEGGLVDATKSFDVDSGLLFVTFRSFAVKTVPTCLKAGSSLNDDPGVAFQGGAAAVLFRDRIENLEGYRIFTVTAMMKADGSALAVDGSENVLSSFQQYVAYNKPGEIDVSDEDTGPVAYPGTERYVLATITEVLTTDFTLPPSYLPFSVKRWASVNVSYVVASTGISSASSKGASGYLADSSFSGTNVDDNFVGEELSSLIMSAGSDPAPGTFYALNNQVIASVNGPAFITDTGLRLYRRRKVQVVGTFGTYLNV